MAIDLGFRPPVGKVWTREMFMPGYEPKPEEFDWRGEKAKMKLVGKRPFIEKPAATREAELSTLDRFRQAQEAVNRGASREEIRLLMEA